MSGWHLLRPLWLLALPVALGWLWWYGSRRLHAGRWRDLVDSALQPYVLTSGNDSTGGRWLPWWLGALIVLLVVALAGPVKERLPQPVYRNDSALIIALDLSRSMNAQDLLPTRLERARLKVRDLLSQRDEGDTALVVFAGDAFTVTPLTDDTATIEAMLESLTTQIIPRQGSLMAPALMRAGRLFDDAGATEGRVLVLGDGVADRAQAEEAAAALAARGFDTFVLGVGTPEGDVVRNANGELVKDDAGQIVVARTDVAALAAVATAGNGRFTLLTADDADLDGLLSDGESAFVDGVISDDFETDIWREEGPLLVLICLPFIALLFRRGLIIVFAGLMLMPPPTASAGWWQDLWLNDDVQGQQHFEAQEFSAAADKFLDQKWRAASAFRTGEFEKSAQLWSDVNTPDGHYNRGNALAFAGSIDAAREAYEAALALDPEHEDAQYNLDLLNQLPPPPEEQNESSEGDEGEESSDGEQSEGEGGEQGDQAPSEDGEGQSQNADAGDEQEGDAGESDSEGEERDDQQQAQESQDGDEDAQDGEEQTQQALSDEEQERDLAAEQWLRQVPDDPGGLMRRKFERQYRLRYQGRPEEPQAW